MAQSNNSYLRLDKLYRNTNNWKNPEDEFNTFFRFEDGKGFKMYLDSGLRVVRI